MNKANTFDFNGFVLKAKVVMITLIYISKEGGLYQCSLNVNLGVMSHFDNREKVYCLGRVMLQMRVVCAKSS